MIVDDQVVNVAERKARERERVVARLRRVEGQIRGIQRMILEERDCEAIVTQLMAARAALDRASLLVMTHHIEQCLLDPSGQATPAQLGRLIQFFLRFAGPGAEGAAQSDAAASGQPADTA